MKVQALETPFDFDLSKHGWIEASAGTGKTFTIERLVVRAIVEKQTPVSSILAVTFTEKATGELKDRIRGFLQRIVDKTLEGSDQEWLNRQQEQSERNGMRPTLEVVEEALQRFDEAAIFTIHGFCQSLLIEYAFELGRLLKYELVDDNEILELLIPDALRRLPAQEVALKDALVRAEFWKRTYTGEHRLENILHNLLRMRKGSGRLHVAAPSEDSPMHLLPGLVNSIEARLHQYKAERGLISYDDMIRHVRDAVCSESGASLAREVGRRYRYAIIDEFQDTDVLQWDIFRSCFLESSAEAGRLILVGDPKQSIYRFRGADLNSYFRARRYLVSLTEKRKAALYRINRNYRSSLDFIRSVNAIFCSSRYPWNAAPMNDTLEYVPKDPPGTDRWAGTELPEKRCPINLWKPEGKDSIARIRRRYGRFICNEIHALVADGGRIQKDGRPMKITYGDICVLARRKKDALIILDHLREAGIPSSFYKQPGVFESVEALEILYVLEALAEPARSSAVKKAFITRFFGFNIENVQDVDELSAGHPSRERLQRWHELASEDRWPQLFREMLAIDEITGLVHTDPGGWERSLTNYEQILQTLEERAVREGLDLTAVVSRLKELMREGSVEEEETLHRQETEEPRVRVMTIHAAKGLEFPVVFLYGGLTEGSSVDCYQFYKEDEPVLVPVPWFEPDKSWFKSSEEGQQYKKWHDEYARAEDARLYYVALTRAALMCYMPALRPGGHAGPVGKFLQDALDDAVSEAPELFAYHPDSPSRRQKSVQRPKKEEPIQPLPEPVLPDHLQDRKSSLLSYSAVVRRRAEHVDREEQDHDAVSPPELLEEAEPRDDVLLTRLDTLFRGTEAGNFFHSVLERLDFQDPAFHEEQADASLSRWNRILIRRQLEQFGYRADAEYEEPVSMLLHRLMRTELFPGFRLRDLKPQDRIHEMEFVFLHADRRQEQKGETFFTGFIDLVFRHAGKVYLLDWKTNRLPGYDRSHLEEAMRWHQYDLQYALYARALQDWLEYRGLNVQTDFGGVIYLFLRGVRPGSSDGIYFDAAGRDVVRSRILEEVGS